MMTAQYQSALQSYAEGRYEEAMQQFSELLHEDPRNPKLHIWLGATFRKAGKIEYAKVQYQQVLTLTDDPDLLDLASTSLAQIQNKLANASQRNTLLKDIQKDIPKDAGSHQNLQNQTSPQKASRIVNSQPISTRSNGVVKNSPITNHVTGSDENMVAMDVTPLATSSLHPEPKPKVGVNPQSNGNGLVPPPPKIAALFQNQQQKNNQEKRQSNPFVNSGDITEKQTLSTLNDLIANSPEDLNQITKKTKKAGKGKQEKLEVEFVALEPVLSGKGDDNNGSQQVNSLKSSAISLEDMFKFSSVGQKITLWGALLATIPAIALGITAYQVGGGLLLNKVKQGQQSEAIALAKATGSFLKQKTAEVDMFKKLLGSSTEVGQNLTTSNLTETNKTMKPLSSLPIAQQRQYKQQLTNRLNLYSQAYPQYSSIAIFSISGEFLAQSNNSKTLQTLNPNYLNKVTAGDSVLISNPIVGKEGAYFYAVTSVKSSISQQASMILQIEIPVKSLVSELANTGTTNTGSSNFYVIDSANKYIASSQPIAIGEDVSADLAMLSDLRSAQAPDVRDVVRSDHNNEQIIAYASVPNMQSYGVLNWDVLTTLDKATAISANQNLLLVIGSGIALTPLLVGAIAYALTRRLSARLQDIRSALRDFRKGAADHSFGTFSGTLSVKGNDELADISLSINKMSEQFHVMSQKQEQEKQRMQLQVVKMFKVLSKLAREEKQEVNLEVDLSDENILLLGKKIRAEMVQRNAEVKSYQKQKEDLQGQLMQMLREMQALADGDLTISSKAIEGDLSDVGIFFDDVMRGLQNIVGQVKSSANQVNFSLGQNEQAIANLTSISQRQVDTVTRSLNSAQMFKVSATTITNNSQQVIQSSQMIAKKILDSDHSIDAVMEKVGELQSTVSTTAKRVKHLGEASQKIAKAISAINEIAIKTNFLAINATLEAARTGDMGSGFVMVAEEVGELASRSVAATKEVEALLGSIQNETKAVMAAVESGSNQVTASNTLAIAAKDSLQQIAEISQQIDHLVSSISDATISQVQTSEGVANLMKDISHIAKRNLTSSSEVSKFLKVTKQHSGDLQQSLTHFKTR